MIHAVLPSFPFAGIHMHVKTWRAVQGFDTSSFWLNFSKVSTNSLLEGTRIAGVDCVAVDEDRTSPFGISIELGLH